MAGIYNRRIAITAKGKMRIAVISVRQADSMLSWLNLAERLICNQQVIGSIPIGSSNGFIARQPIYGGKHCAV